MKNTWRKCLLFCGVLFSADMRASLRRSIQKKHLAGMFAPLRNVVQYRSGCFSAEHNLILYWGAGILAPQRSVVQYRSACFSAEQN